MNDDDLNKCFAVAEQMLQAAKEERWDEVDELEGLWSTAVRRCLLNNTQPAQQVARLLDLNNDIIGLIQNRQNYIANELAGFNKGRKAMKAYGNEH